MQSKSDKEMMAINAKALAAHHNDSCCGNDKNFRIA
jgi:hypothetical protein